MESSSEDAGRTDDEIMEDAMAPAARQKGDQRQGLTSEGHQGIISNVSQGSCPGVEP